MASSEATFEFNARRVRVVKQYFLGSVDNAFLTKIGAHLTGWSVLNTSNGPPPAPPALFLVMSHKGLVVAVEPNKNRPDIARKFGKEALACGLSIDLSLDVIPEPLVAKFDVFAYDGLDTATRLDFFVPNNALDEVDIASNTDFMKLVQDPSTRTKNKNTLLYASLHAIHRFPGDFLVCSAATCVIGYRILDHEVNDPDIRALFYHEIYRLLSIQPDISKGLFLRWHTSLRLIAGYVTYQQGDRRKSGEHFDRILDFIADLPAWPTALTNVLIGIYASGYLMFEQDQQAEALQRWRRAEEVLQFGLRLVKFTNYYSYGELNNALNVARECHMAILVVESGGPLNDPTIAPEGLGLDPRTAPGPIGRLSAEYRAFTGEADPVARYKGIRPRR